MTIDVVERFLALPSDQNSWSDEDWQLLFDRNTFFTVCSGAEIYETLEQLNNLLPVEYILTSSSASSKNIAGKVAIDELTIPKIENKFVMIDFYADWCKPCKMIAPFLDELAIEYKGKVNITNQ